MKVYNTIYNTNLFLLTDFYELSMMQGYFYYDRNTEVVFELSFRKTPFNSGFIIFAGLQPLIEIILGLKVDKEDIEYISSLGLFKKEFLDYLKNFKFTGSIYSVEEGEIVFPKEPVLRVHAPVIQAQFLESIILNIINFQSLIATKTARIVESAKGKTILEFGLRRAQGIDGAISATRAAFIGGAAATSNVLSAKIFGIPPKGTMAHSWVMSFSSEYGSFEKFSELYPENTIFLIDTYNTKSGIKNAIKIFKKLKKKGIKNFGVRIDSGDLETLSKFVRKELDSAGFKEAKIVVSNELDEFIIEQLLNRGSPIDIFGVGTKLITGHPDASLGGVYKIVAKKVGKKIIPLMKISDTPQKISLPHIKNVVRVFKENKFLLDVVCLENEKLAKYEFFYDIETDFKIKIVDNNKTEQLLRPIVKDGNLVYDFPNIYQIRENTKHNLSLLPDEYKRLINPHIYKVCITEKLKLQKEYFIKNSQKYLTK